MNQTKNQTQTHTKWLETIRNETADEHCLIEGAMPVLHENFTPEMYVALLKRLYGFYKPFENQISQSKLLETTDLDFSKRKKTRWLEQDLLEFDSSIDLSSLAVNTSLPHLKNLPEVLGALYVTEGSTLGGSIIFKHLKQRAEFSDRPIRFFAAHETQTGKMWREFLTLADSYIRENEVADSVSTARQTFKSLREWLTP